MLSKHALLDVLVVNHVQFVLLFEDQLHTINLFIQNRAE